MSVVNRSAEKSVGCLCSLFPPAVPMSKAVQLCLLPHSYVTSAPSSPLPYQFLRPTVVSATPIRYVTSDTLMFLFSPVSAPLHLDTKKTAPEAFQFLLLLFVCVFTFCVLGVQLYGGLVLSDPDDPANKALTVN